MIEQVIEEKNLEIEPIETPTIITTYDPNRWIKVHELKDTDGKYHCDNGPAILYKDGRGEWYKHGEYHREDGPAVIWGEGTQNWYLDGKRHRKDGPAIIYKSGNEEWYINGKHHKDDGPAVVYRHNNEVTEKWYRNGNLHRKDGPAIAFKDNKNNITFAMWYSHGKKHRTDGPAVVDYKTNHEEWYKQGKVHREDGPAMTDKDGNRLWIENDILHREDGPAIMNSDGSYEHWWYGGKHQLFEPAVRDKDKNEEYWLYGQQLSEEWNHLLSHMFIYELLPYNKYLAISSVYNLLTDEMPALVLGLDSPVYHINGCIHRKNNPAYIEIDGTEHWFCRGEYHREDGPAIYGPDDAHWYLDNEEFDFDEWAKLVELDDTDKLFYTLKYSTKIT